VVIYSYGWKLFIISKYGLDNRIALFNECGVLAGAANRQMEYLLDVHIGNARRSAHHADIPLVGIFEWEE